MGINIGLRWPGPTVDPRFSNSRTSPGEDATVAPQWLRVPLAEHFDTRCETHGHPVQSGRLDPQLTEGAPNRLSACRNNSMPIGVNCCLS